MYVCVCVYVTVDSSSEDESVSEAASSSVTEQHAAPAPTATETPAPTPAVTEPTLDTESPAVSATAAVDVLPTSTDQQVVVDVAAVTAFYQNEPSVRDDEVQQQEQQQPEPDADPELIDHYQSDVDVLPTSRPQCIYKFLSFFS